MDNIENLYQCYEVLSQAGDKITEVRKIRGYGAFFWKYNRNHFHQHSDKYSEILKAVKGSSKEKRLASQFIGAFFKHFPDLSDSAIDAQLDLVEDEDIQVSGSGAEVNGIFLIRLSILQIRRQAIKDLPKLCLDNKEHTPKIGDTLAQLLILDEPLEVQQVNASLSAIIKVSVLVSCLLWVRLHCFGIMLLSIEDIYIPYCNCSLFALDQTKFVMISCFGCYGKLVPFVVQAPLLYYPDIAGMI